MNSEALLLRLQDRQFFELNATARDILALTDGLRSFRDIRAIIAQKYQIPEETVQDIDGLYQELCDQNIAEAL